MARINDIYVFVQSEELAHDVESTSHPVEEGIEITDHVRRKAPELSLSGKIVDYEGEKANEIIAKLKQLQKEGSLIYYIGRNTMTNGQIQNFSTSHPYTNAGGADFTMTIKEVRIAKSAYVEPSPQVSTEPNLSVGAIVIFKGGSVYVSSDASKPAANRERSACEITIINERDWAKHPYHLISTDGKMVYGWVDGENIEGVPINRAGKEATAGTQKVSEGQNVNVYHRVKSGDNVYNLVTKDYKTLGPSFNTISEKCNWVMENNPHAFGAQGDFGTLKTGELLWIGTRW